MVGERWALLVVRELVLGPKRFTDLRTGLPLASPNVLSQRLRDLEQAGIVRRRRLPPPAASAVYELTEWGQGLEPVLQALGRWGVRSPSLPEVQDIGQDSFVLALRTMYDPVAAAGLTATYELRLGDHSFGVRITEGGFEVAPGMAQAPGAVLTGTPSALAAVLLGSRPLDEAVAAGDVSVEGDAALAERLASAFARPERLPAPALG
nr:winged helix-turn-helix transcriptional regulator [Motilibacter aurantiacus]